VASAGDVNGDGFEDVIVGAPNYASPPIDPGGVNEGGASFVYEGSATGLWLVPAWSTFSPDNYAQLGNAVASAGDVNADGFDDVLVGAWLAQSYDEFAGAAYVFPGSAAGLATTWIWANSSLEDEGTFGKALSSAGDVNADGYADILVSWDSGEFGSEGYVDLYLGSPTGPTEDPSWRDDPDGEYSFGEAVAGAGDVNGDGFDDVVVGAPYEQVGGKAHVFLGSDAPGLPDLCVGDDDSGDADADGYCAYDVLGLMLDCDDEDPARHPGAVEVCNRIDDDCDGTLPPDEADVDLDSFTACDGDCNDTDVAISPARDEVCDDGVDNNCDLVVDEGCDDPPVEPPALDTDDQPIGEEPAPDPAETGCGCDHTTSPVGLVPLAVLVWLARTRKTRNA
jgi:hypothetical protein